MTYTEAQKAAIYNYRATHPDTWKEQQKKNQKSYYERNREACIARVKACKLKKKESSSASEILV